MNQLLGRGKLHQGRRSRRPGRARGIALIEALVGIMIFAFGVLGLVGLQASMTKAQTGARFRADASSLSDELLGVMWSDAAVNLPNYGTSNCNSYVRCKEWKAKLQNQLPAATATVTINAATGEVDIAITWTQPGEGQHNYQTSAVVLP